MTTDAERYASIEHFLKYLDWAKENGVEIEFMNSFLQDYSYNSNINQAVWFAVCEWDL